MHINKGTHLIHPFNNQYNQDNTFPSPPKIYLCPTPYPDSRQALMSFLLPWITLTFPKFPTNAIRYRVLSCVWILSLSISLMKFGQIFVSASNLFFYIVFLTFTYLF